MSLCLIYKDCCNGSTRYRITTKPYTKALLQTYCNNLYESELSSKNLFERTFCEDTYGFIITNIELAETMLKNITTPFKYSYSELKKLHNKNELSTLTFNNNHFEKTEESSSLVVIFYFNNCVYKPEFLIKQEFPKLFSDTVHKKPVKITAVKKIEPVKTTVNTTVKTEPVKKVSNKGIRRTKKTLIVEEDSDDIFI